MDAYEQLTAQLGALPDDWESWLVYADLLSERDDARGALLVLEHRLATAVLPAAEAIELRDRIDALTGEWLATRRHSLGDDDDDWCRWYASLVAALAASERTPEPVKRALTRPMSQLLATLDTTYGLQDGLSPALELQNERLMAAITAWIEQAFDGVPPPDEDHRTLYQAEAADNYDDCDRSRDHLGRWQDLPDEQLMDNQWALPHLDEQGIRYYLPAVMCFALRHLTQPHPSDTWLTESLEYTLQPSSGDLRDYQQRRFQLLDRAQRSAIYAFTVAAGHVEGAAAWRRVFDAETEGDRADWFALYAPR